MYRDVWLRDEGRCRICQISSQESINNDVTRVLPDVPIKWEEATDSHFWVLCTDCKVEILSFLSGNMSKTGVIKKYLRERSSVVQEIDARRKAAKNA